MRNQGSYGVGRGGPRAASGERRPGACLPQRVLPEGKPDFWNVCVEMGEAPRGSVCALGAGRARDPKEQGPGPGAWLPPDPRLLGLRSPVLGAGNMQGSVPPSGLDPVRKEINKKGGEGGRGVRTAWAVQSRPGAQATEANPGHAQAGVRVSLGLGPRYRGLRGPR